MENQNSSGITNTSFFKDKYAKECFAKVDYFLKSGGHIQREYPKPVSAYRFVESNFESLQVYYKDFFRVHLEKGGSDFNKYYFIDFEERNRGEISQEYRQYLKTEFLTIGLLFLKLYKFDGNIELDNVSDFLIILFSEYEDEKEALTKIILNTNSSLSTDRGDDLVKKTVNDAFKKFSELGWIYWVDDKKDRFHYLPSFERLRKMYEQQILNIDELIQEVDNE